MLKKSNPSSNVLEHYIVAIVQFPFFPVIIDNDKNSLAEPDGGINYWLLGMSKKENIFGLTSIPMDENIRQKIKEYFFSDYQNWFNKTISEILEAIIKKENPHIILFPEYSLPLEVNEELKHILQKYSKGRCLVGGIGSVYKNDGKKTNKFVVVNDEYVNIGIKIIPNNDEKQIDISGGKGPLIYQVNLHHQNNKTFIEILMCSDCIEKVKSNSKVQTQIRKEYRENGLKDEDVKISLIPSFSLKIEDMEYVGEICAKRFHVLSALANCNFIGNSFVSFPIIAPGEPSKMIIEKRKSSCIIVDFPTKFIGDYLTTSVGSEIESPKAQMKQYNIIFDNEDIANENELFFKINNEDFCSLISRRLNIAIKLMGFLFSNTDPSEKTLQNLVKISKIWKKIQNKINKYKNNFDYSYKKDSNLDQFFLYYLLSGCKYKEFYLLLLERIKDSIDDPNYQRKIQELINYIDTKNILLEPPLYWEDQKLLGEPK